MGESLTLQRPSLWQHQVFPRESPSDFDLDQQLAQQKRMMFRWVCTLCVTSAQFSFPCDFETASAPSHDRTSSASHLPPAIGPPRSDSHDRTFFTSTLRHSHDRTIPATERSLASMHMETRGAFHCDRTLSAVTFFLCNSSTSHQHFLCRRQSRGATPCLTIFEMATSTDFLRDDPRSAWCACPLPLPASPLPASVHGDCVVRFVAFRKRTARVAHGHWKNPVSSMRCAGMAETAENRLARGHIVRPRSWF